MTDHWPYQTDCPGCGLTFGYGPGSDAVQDYGREQNGPRTFDVWAVVRCPGCGEDHTAWA